jgi:hypothetical protein
MYLVFPDDSWTAGPDEAAVRKAVTDLTHEHWNLRLAKRLSGRGLPGPACTRRYRRVHIEAYSTEALG